MIPSLMALAAQVYVRRAENYDDAIPENKNGTEVRALVAFLRANEEVGPLERGEASEKTWKEVTELKAWQEYRTFQAHEKVVTLARDTIFPRRIASSFYCRRACSDFHGLLKGVVKWHRKWCVVGPRDDQDTLKTRIVHLDLTKMHRAFVSLPRVIMDEVLHDVYLVRTEPEMEEAGFVEAIRGDEGYFVENALDIYHYMGLYFVTQAEFIHAERRRERW